VQQFKQLTFGSKSQLVQLEQLLLVLVLSQLMDKFQDVKDRRFYISIPHWLKHVLIMINHL
jgi:hypothetical protein